jgi:hypothetical protein
MFNSLKLTYSKRKLLPFPLKLLLNKNLNFNIFNFTKLTKFNFSAAANPNHQAHKKDHHNDHHNHATHHNDHSHSHGHGHGHGNHNDHHEHDHHDDHHDDHHHHHEEVKEYHDFKFDRVSYNQKLTEETREK